MRNLLIVLLICCLQSSVLGQYQSSIIYTNKDGLPHSELYQVFADSRGRVWFSSAGGLTYFDGNKFHTLTERDGLPTRSIGKILEDGNGNIWLQSGNSHGTNFNFITVINTHNKIDTILNIQAFAGESGRILYDKYTQKIGVFCNRSELWEFDSDEKQFRLKHKFKLKNKPFTGSIYISAFSNKHFLQHYNESQDSSQLFTFKDGELEILPPSPLFNNADIGIIGGLPEEALLVHLRKQPETFFRYSPKDGWATFSPGTDTLPKDYHLAQCLDQPSVIICHKTDNINARLIEISECFPSGISYSFKMPEPYLRSQAPVKSKDGSYWISTRNGLKRVFPQFLDCLGSWGENRILDLHGICEDDEGKVWFSSYSYGLTYFDGEGLYPAPDFLSQFTQFLPGSYKDQKGNMYFALNNSQPGENGILKFDGKEKYSIELTGHLGYYFHESFDHELGYAMSKKGLAIKDLDDDCWEQECWTTYGPEKGFGLTNALTTVKDHFGRWWMGRSSTGLAYYDSNLDTIFNFYRLDHKKDYGVMSSLMDKKGNLWFGTSHGLCFFENRENIDPSSFDPVKEFQRVGLRTLGESLVTSLILLNKNTLVIGNEKGFGLLDLESFYAGKPVFQFFNEHNGFSGGFTEQNAVWKDRMGRIWLGSDLGAHRLDPRYLIWDKKAPEISIDSLIAGGKPYFPGEDILHLNPKDQRVRIFLNPGFDSLLQNNVFFQYKLQTDTFFTDPFKDRIVEFANLGPGTYTFEVKAIKNGIESDLQSLTFKIPKFFWQQIWFWALILFLIGFVVRYYERSLEKQKSEKNKLHIQAIVNQLNPHFINNALQWVQVRVYNDQEAVKVISKLGENIRIVFKNSREKKPYHSLADEIKLVENYLFIQKQRFGKNLEYVLPPAQMIEKFKEINLPLMQIQIHCENAVEHGIRNKEDGEGGLLQIQFTEEEKHLHITVEDNGIGRRKAAEIGSKGTQRGTKMLEDLKNILNKRNINSIRYQYEDDIFKTPEGVGFGTRMHIWIPKKYNYELD